jgi:HEAT repeat protein
MDIATDSKDRDLRLEAVRDLGTCERLGPTFLAKIVDSPADDEVRAMAMELRCREPRAEDAEWYRAHYAPGGRDQDKRKGAQPKKGGKKPDGAGEAADGAESAVPRTLWKVRVAAFRAWSGFAKPAELIEALEDEEWGIRAAALEELERRQDPQAARLAKKRYEDDKDVRVQEAAARIVGRAEGVKFGKQLLEDATKSMASPEFRAAIAEVIIELGDPDLPKKLGKLVGANSRGDQLFGLGLAGRAPADAGLDKSIVKEIENNELIVACAAIRALGARRVESAQAALEELLADELGEEEQSEPLLVALLEALSALRTDDAEWNEQILAWATDARAELRNAAVIQLGLTAGATATDALVAALAHPAWTTRYAALSALAARPEPRVVDAIVRRMADESGRMLKECADAMYRLSGQTFGSNAEAWAKWWERAQATFEPISAERLAELEERRANELERQTTYVRKESEFFGLRIQSSRVIFVLDVSGSMNEFSAGRYEGQHGEPRIDVAKRELFKALEQLDPTTLFNVVTFESSVNPWLDQITDASPAHVAEAKDFVEELGALGGTNLYGALRVAFADPDVDTIYVLSDGEPSVGDVVDPQGIRERVQGWNERRGVRVNTIAVGGRFRILEWLAQDTGGVYLEFP